jgi:hypothetical protein
MSRAIKTYSQNRVAQQVVAGFMMVLLLWITSANFLYLITDNTCCLSASLDGTDGDEEGSSNCPTGNPAGPDEKSPDAPITFSEEFIHEHQHFVNAHWSNLFFQHKVHETEQLCIFHPELFSPPPEA